MLTSFFDAITFTIKDLGNKLWVKEQNKLKVFDEALRNRHFDSKFCIVRRCEAKMSSKNRVTVNLVDEEYFTLNELASHSKVSKAWLVRHAVGELLEGASNDGKQLSLPLLAITRKGV